MDEVLIKAILESQENDTTILKALVKVVDDLEEIKEALKFLTGK